MIVEILAVLFFVFSVFLCFAGYRLTRRLLEFDELFQLLAHDIETNVKYLAKLVNTPLFLNSPEVLEVQRNMRIMAERLREYLVRIGEATNKPSEKKLPPNPPVVI